MRLDDYPHYEAVSYTWGHPNDKGMLNCNNKTISVPRNLIEGLRMLRRPDRLRILWADAVCINQKDLEERSSQVTLMARVFSETSKALVWLGHGKSSLIWRAFSYICWYLNRKDSHNISSYSWGREMSVDDSEATAFKILTDDATMEALRYLFKRPYCSRGWIVQELVLPRSVKVYCEEACVNYRFLESFVRKSLISDAQRVSSYRFQLEDYRISWIWQLRRQDLHDNPTTIAFTGILMLTREQNFSDPRDCVYGLLGLERLCHGECRVAWTMTCGNSLSGGRLWGHQQREVNHMNAYRDFVTLDTEETKRPYEFLEGNVEAKAYYHTASRYVKQYALFETEDNQLGISRSSIQPGDQVVIFLGGRMPFVLRPVGARWRLIGVCYVYDIMDGGPVKQMKHDPRYMAEDFDII